MDRILTLIRELGTTSPKELSRITGLSRQMIHRHLKRLLRQQSIEKIGAPPRVYYRNQSSVVNDTTENYGISEKNIIEQRFIAITEKGEYHQGLKAFEVWCQKRNLPYIKTAHEYLKTLKKYDQYVEPGGWINGTHKLRSTDGLGDIHIDDLFYIDFYAIERFGKTSLGQLLHFGKQSQNLDLMDEIVKRSKPIVHRIIKTYNIKSVAYVPPTIQRKVQIMHELESGLDLRLPTIQLEKLKGEIIVPQKALSKIRDRVVNARTTIVTSERRQYENVLIIDDAVGSGATINESAQKLRQRKITAKIYGLAITSSYKDFEVISEA